MSSLPSSYFGFGVTTVEVGASRSVRIDPRGTLDIGFDLRWNEAGFWLGMQRLNESPIIPSFDTFRRSALLQLDSFAPEQIAALNELRIEMTSTSQWLVELSERELVLHLGAWPSASKCEALLKALTDVAQTFAKPSSTELSRLLHGARNESDVVRRRYDLYCLQRRYLQHQEAIDYFVDLTQGDDGDVRHQAAQALVECHPHMHKLAEMTFREVALNAAYAPTLRALALSDYCRLCEPTEKLTMLKKLSLGSDWAVAAIAIDKLDALPGGDAVPILLAIIAARDDDIGLAAIRKLTHFPLLISRFERDLLQCLDLSINQRVKEQIIDVLGEVGTRESLATLTSLARGTIFNSPSRHAARAAVDLLRRRFPGEGGALTIAGDGGEISKVES